MTDLELENALLSLGLGATLDVHYSGTLGLFTVTLVTYSSNEPSWDFYTPEAVLVWAERRLPLILHRYNA